MLDLERWQEDGVVINLLLTRRCNFECEHCFYDCGPHWRGYMKNDVLKAIREQVERLKELEIPLSINLVGGEPTLNMSRFSEILDEVMRWDVDVEMTTNGWWLHKDATARKFFNIVARCADNDGMGLDTSSGRAFSIRISDDEFHDPFRPDYFTQGKMKQQLAAVWEYERDIIMTSKPVCQECWHEFQDMPDYDECPKCGGYVEYGEEEMLDWHLPQPNDGDPWIYVESRNGSSYGRVIPTGRANSWGRNDVGCRKYSNVNGLSFLPNGKLMDICCRGSWCEFGTVEDDPLLLLELARRFTLEEKPSCCDCRERAKDWKRRRFRTVKAELQREIEGRIA